MIGGHILIDFDGTLAKDTDPYHPTQTGEPIEQSVNRVKNWLARGIEVKIFTARVADDPDGLAEAAVKAWCTKHLGQELEVTNKKTYTTFLIYDDRAISVEKNTGEILIPYNFVRIHEKE